MSQAFLNKSRNIILKNIENDQFGVSQLASELNLSRSQVLRKIKSETGQSANQFIRQIRLEEAVKLLQKNELTASEISFKVGFSSPSYFNKCFHEQYGFTPGDYKNNTKAHIAEPITDNRKTVNTKNKKRFNILIIITVFLLVLIFAFWKIQYSDKRNLQMQSASIAVLPLLDLSEKKDKEYLSIGLTDAITLELSRLKGLRVPSRGSAMLFQDSVLLYSEIAEKLGVDLLLEGSVIYGHDSLRVTVQLINPNPIEKHIWANSYDQSTNDILHLSRNISNQIAKEIHLIVNGNNRETTPGEFSAKAQELYLRGKMLWQKQNPNSVELAIKYIKEAIELEPDFARAYCSLAEAYMSKNKMFPGNNEEKLKNKMESQIAINYALDKAIELDGSLAEAYITKGMIMRKVNWDWEGMKRMAEKGLELNPNNKDGYMLLSDYYLIKGNHKKSVQQALIAEEYDPLNPRIGCLVAERYMLAGKYEKAIKQYKKVFELFPDYSFAWDGIGFAYFLSGDKEQAKNSWMEFHKTMGNNHMSEYFDHNDFNNSVSYIVTKFAAGDKLYCSNPPIIAMAHILINKKEGALKYLDIAMEYRNEDLPVLILSLVFKPLHDNNHYLKLIKQLNLSLNQ